MMTCKECGQPVLLTREGAEVHITPSPESPKYQPVAGAVIVKDERIFLTQRRADQSFPGFWHLPGGKFEPKDVTMRECLRREILEELNVDCVVGELIARTRVRFKGKTSEAYDIEFYRTTLVQTVDTSKLTDCRDADWFCIYELPALSIIPIDRAVAVLALEEAELT